MDASQDRSTGHQADDDLRQVSTSAQQTDPKTDPAEIKFQRDNFLLQLLAEKDLPETTTDAALKAITVLDTDPIDFHKIVNDRLISDLTNSEDRNEQLKSLQAAKLEAVEVKKLCIAASALGKEIGSAYLERCFLIVDRGKYAHERIAGLKGVVLEAETSAWISQQGLENVVEDCSQVVIGNYRGLEKGLSEFSLNELYKYLPQTLKDKIDAAFEQSPEAANDVFIENFPQRLRKKVLKEYVFDGAKQKNNSSRDFGCWKRKPGKKGINANVRQVYENFPFTHLLSKQLEEFAFGNHEAVELTDVDTKEPLDFDVCIQKGEAYYLLDTKFSGRKPFGFSPQHVNQALKYQQAIEQGLIEGASYLVNGRIDPSFMFWAVGTAIDDRGAIPDVEIIYDLPLPGGSAYRFVLKMSEHSNGQEGLRFQNSGRYTTRERKIINGIREAIWDRSIYDVLTDLKREDFPKLASLAGESLDEILANPRAIEDPFWFETYETERVKAIWDKLAAKHDQYIRNSGDVIDACHPDASPEYVSQLFYRFQAEIKHNPELRQQRKSYLVEDEEIQQEIIDETVNRIAIIKENESRRKENEQNTSEGQAKAMVREEMGWHDYLPEEGIPLDVTHIMMDVIHHYNKGLKGQSPRRYDAPERFIRTPEELASKLKNISSQRYIEVRVLDPTKENGRRIGIHRLPKRPGDAVSEESISDIQRSIRKENLRRLIDAWNDLEEPRPFSFKIAQTLKKIEAIKEQRDTEIKAEREKIISVARKEKRKPSSEEFKIVQQISKQALEAIEQLEEDQYDFLTQALGDEVCDNLLVSLQNIHDQEIMKLAYVVDSDGNLIMDHEVIRGDASLAAGRASHSELASGLNTYGAGEDVLEKHDRTFSTFTEWYDFQQEYNPSASWTFKELNNGSGHYRPISAANQYALNVTREFFTAYRQIYESQEAPEVIFPEGKGDELIRDAFARGALAGKDAVI